MDLIKNAKDCDNKNNYEKALEFYEKGIKYFDLIIKSIFDSIMPIVSNS